MDGDDQVFEQLLAAIGGAPRGRAAADQLCRSLTQALQVDGTAVTVHSVGDAIGRPMGSSGPLSQELVELQSMLGEGPSLAAVELSAVVSSADLRGLEVAAWPNFAAAASGLGVGAVFALPVSAGGVPVGALLLYRHRPAQLTFAELTGAYFAAELAMLPILDVAGYDLHLTTDDDTGAGWAELTALTRSEIYQAAGVLIAQLGITPTEALVRLRAHAFAYGKTTSETAYDILGHRVHLGDDDRGDDDSAPTAGLEDQQ